MKKLDLFVGGSALQCIYLFILQTIVFIIAQYPGVVSE